MKVALLGDIHGDVVFLNRALGYAVGNDADIMIQLGDFGFTYTDGFLSALDRLTTDYKMPLYAIRGNHDDPWWFRKCQRMGYVNFIPDGQLMTLGATRVAFLGGAVSIDRNWREENISWWKDERVSARVVNSWVMNNEKADVLLSHEAPTKPENLPGFTIPEDILVDCDEDRRNVQVAVDQLGVNAVYHGHYHVRETNSFQSTNLVTNEPENDVLVESIASNFEDIEDSIMIVEF